MLGMIPKETKDQINDLYRRAIQLEQELLPVVERMSGDKRRLLDLARQEIATALMFMKDAGAKR